MTKVLRPFRTAFLGRPSRPHLPIRPSNRPVILSLARSLTRFTPRPRLSSSPLQAGARPQRSAHTRDATSIESNGEPAASLEATLPLSCPGCGALTQWVDADEAGFYTAQRKAVKAYMLSRLQATHVPDGANDQGHGTHTSDIPDSKPSLNEPPDTLQRGTYYARYSATAAQLTLPQQVLHLVIQLNLPSVIDATISSIITGALRLVTRRSLRYTKPSLNLLLTIIISIMSWMPQTFPCL